MRTSEVLNKAADLIEERGWSQGTGWFPAPGSTTPVCLEGALAAARDAVTVSSRCSAFSAVVAYLTTTRPEAINRLQGKVIPFSWNDRPGRTASEVIEVLRACAVIEAAREEQDAAAATYAENLAVTA